jgi:hypothetical protein
MSFFFFECCKCTVLETNESTADTRGQSQVHCTRQGSTAYAKKTFGTVFLKEIHRKETFAHTWQKHTRETHQEEYARQNPSAVSRVLVFLALQNN